MYRKFYLALPAILLAMASLACNLNDLNQPLIGGTDAPAATQAPENSQPVVDTGTMPEPITTSHQGNWTVLEMERLKDNPIVVAWIDKLQDPAPGKWQVYPNVANPLVPSFNVKNGMEYGQDDSPFCEQDQRCDWVVPAWHYRLISGDYVFQGTECKNTDTNRKGCLIILINVMDQSYTWRNQSVDNGLTIMGRYWNGDRLDQGLWGLVSHASANMLGMKTIRDATTGNVLNSGNGDNAGANCGTPDSCPNVDVTVVIHAGDEILAVLKTIVTR